jgi:hypothetical protein
MTHQQHTKLTRRTALRTAAASFASVPVLSRTADAAARPLEDQLLTDADVPQGYQQHDITPSEAPFFRELRARNATQGATAADRGFVKYEGEQPIAGAGTFALRYDGQRPRFGEIKQALAASLKGFEAELIGSTPSRTSSRVTDNLVEWQLTVLEAAWDRNAPYRDVTHLRVDGRTVLGATAYGPVTENRDPLRAAHRYDTIVSRRLREADR